VHGDTLERIAAPARRERRKRNAKVAVNVTI
jgi:hypothetical protein